MLKDGVSIIEIYGVDLDKAIEGDNIGVMRTGQVGEYECPITDFPHFTVG